MFFVSARLLVIFAWIVSTDVGIRPFGRRTAVPRLERQPAGRVLVGGELVGDSFDEVGEARSLAVVIGDAEMPASADMTAAAATGPRGRYRGWTGGHYNTTIVAATPMPVSAADRDDLDVPVR